MSIEESQEICQEKWNNLTTSPANSIDARLTPSVTNSNPNNCNSDTRLTPRVKNSTDTNTDTVPSKKKLWFDDLTTITTTTLEANVTTNSEPMDEDINFVDDILDSTCEMEDVQSVQSLDWDDEFNVEVWSVSKAQNWPFRPLTELTELNDKR